MELEKLKLGLSTSSVFYALMGVVVGSLFMFFVLSVNTVTDQTASNNLVSVLESQTGQEWEAVSIEEDKGMYKVNVRNPENQLATYYVTKDGESFTQALTNMDQLQSAIDARNDFQQCLSSNNVVLYGNLSQQATRLQIQALGGTQTVAPIYQDVNNNQTLAQAAQRGIRQIPSLYSNDSVLSGVNQLAQVEEFTGCEYRLSQN